MTVHAASANIKITRRIYETRDNRDESPIKAVHSQAPAASTTANTNDRVSVVREITPHTARGIRMKAVIRRCLSTLGLLHLLSGPAEAALAPGE